MCAAVAMLGALLLLGRGKYAKRLDAAITDVVAALDDAAQSSSQPGGFSAPKQPLHSSSLRQQEGSQADVLNASGRMTGAAMMASKRGSHVD